MQTYFKHGMGDTIRLYFEIFKNNIGQIGEFPTVAIQKQSTSEWLNDSKDTWQITYNEISLTETTSGNLPGIYHLDITHIDNTSETYNCYFKNTGINTGNDFENHIFTGAVYVPDTSTYDSDTVLGNLDQIKNKDGNRTFDQSTDSLEAIVDIGISSLTLEEIENSAILSKEATLLSISGDIAKIDDGLFSEGGSISKVIVQPVQGNFNYARIKKQEVEIKLGDSPSISYNLNSDISSYSVWFMAKETYDTTTIAISSREITNYVSDATIGIGTIPLSIEDTNIEPGDYIGEIQLRNNNIILTPSEFKLKLLNSIF